MTNQEMLQVITDVMMGPLGAIVFTGALILTPALLLGVAIAHGCGLISIRIRDAAIASASVLYLLLVAWFVAFYGIGLVIAWYGRPDVFGVSAALFAMSVPLMITPMIIIRRFLKTGSVGPR